MTRKPVEIVPETLHPDLYIRVTVNLSEHERKTWANALDDVGYGMSDAANLFALVKDLIDDDAAKDGVRSLMTVCAAHFKAMVNGPVDGVFSMAQRLHMERHQAEEARAEKGKAE
jgi:hypothetical protein